MASGAMIHLKHQAPTPYASEAGLGEHGVYAMRNQESDYEENSMGTLENVENGFVP